MRGTLYTYIQDVAKRNESLNKFHKIGVCLALKLGRLLVIRGGENGGEVS